MSLFRHAGKRNLSLALAAWTMLASAAEAETISLRVLSAEIRDASDDGFLQPGEPASLKVIAQNQWASPVKDLVASATTETPGVTIQSPVFLGDLPAGVPGAKFAFEFPLVIAAEACGQEFAIAVELEARGNSLAQAMVPSFGGVRDVRAKVHLDESFSPLPDGDGLVRERTLTTPPGALGKRVSFGVSVDHEQRGEVDIIMELPSLEILTLFDGQEGDDAPNVAAFFDAPQLIDQPVAGQYRFAVFDRVTNGSVNNRAKGWTLLAEYEVVHCDPWSEEPPPILGFKTLPLEDWEFASGDGSFFDVAYSSGAGGLSIGFAPAVPQSPAPFATGFWTSPRFDELEFENGRIYAFRASISGSRSPDAGCSTRLRVEPVQGSVDHVFNINATNEGPFAPPKPRSKDYLFYARPADLDVPGRNILAFDAVDDGNPSGIPRAVILHSLQVTSTDADAFLGAENAVISFGSFSNWSYQNYGELSFGDFLIHEGGTSEISQNGAPRHLDDDDPVGGAAEWHYGQFGLQRVETRGGALYRARWTVAAEDAGDGTYPRARLNIRATYPALSVEYLIRGDGPLFDAAGNAQSAVYEQNWVGHDFEGPSGSTNDKDNIALAFGLFNMAAGVTGRDGALELRAMAVEMISPNDPNVD
jgi:hypothetical protein